MIQVGSNTYKNFLEYYSIVMERYFRKAPPIPSNVYLSPDVIEETDVRINVARNCHFPAIINQLANDENEAVSEAARENEFWVILGRFQDILGFGKKERKEFARVESNVNLVTLLMFEDDLEIIHDTLNNPSLSFKMLALFIRLLKERGQGRKDEQIYEMAQQVLEKKKQQIFNISAINKAARNLDNSDNIITILKSLAEEDPTLRSAIHNNLEKVEINLLRKVIMSSLDDKLFETNLQHFVVLSQIISHIQRRDDLHNTSITYLKLKDTSPEVKGLSIGAYFTQLLNKKRIAIVKLCADDLMNFDNVILLCYCHVDNDRQINDLASKIIRIDEIINLLNDYSTPRRVFKTILGILELHKDESVVEQVHETHLRETHRLKDSMKELEVSVQAYFDIIFRSLGYNQINEYQDVIKAVNLTEKQIAKFDHILRDKLGSKRYDLIDIFEKIREIFAENARSVYFDVSPKTVKELEYILSLIVEIFNLRDMGLASLRPGTPEDIESEIKSRARVIWQSAISIYLGRIKDLTEMIRKKIAKTASEQYGNNEFDREMQSATKDLEASYKDKVQCNLTNTCAVCNRRGCASERFLTEGRFFIEEFIDNFLEPESEEA